MAADVAVELDAELAVAVAVAVAEEEAEDEEEGAEEAGEAEAEAADGAEAEAEAEAGALCAGSGTDRGMPSTSSPDLRCESNAASESGAAASSAGLMRAGSSSAENGSSALPTPIHKHTTPALTAQLHRQRCLPCTVVVDSTFLRLSGCDLHGISIDRHNFAAHFSGDRRLRRCLALILVLRKRGQLFFGRCTAETQTGACSEGH